MTYVQEQEAKAKAEYWHKVAWIRLCGLWREIGVVMDHTRDMEYHKAEISKIRAQYVKRGRVAKVAA